MEQQAESITGKLRKSLFVLKQLSQVVSLTVLKQAYYAFIYSHLSWKSDLGFNDQNRLMLNLLPSEKGNQNYVKYEF